ncbi:MAG: DUF4410 domain-containing protein [Terriglobia bacterium]
MTRKLMQAARYALLLSLSASIQAYSQPLKPPSGSPVAAQQQDAKASKNKYQQVEIARFTVKDGIEFPDNYLTTLMGELVAQLQETNKFQHVFREGESQGAGEAPALRLTGAITAFDKGNRAVRYVIGFGAGKTKIKAHVKFSDRATGQTIYEGDVDGKVIIGFFGGESIGATRGLAKEVAKIAKQKLIVRRIDPKAPYGSSRPGKTPGIVASPPIFIPDILRDPWGTPRQQGGLGGRIVH